MSGAAQSFYGRWARLYDVVARDIPGVAGVRRRAAAALELDRGDTVVEMGCGTGANLGYLREQVGPEGTVVGVDFTRQMLARARRFVAREGWDNVHLVYGDATRPPLREVDGVLATFVLGMLDDQYARVDEWCDLAAGGNVVLVDAAPSKRPYGPLVNLSFRAFVVLSTPPTTQLRYDRDLLGGLEAAATDAREALRDRSTAITDSEHLLGFVRVTGGRIAEE
jgi:phosphatidylethanolamine/phosphatidyl-N-methylethanolamine N-methyltransferase